MRINEIVSPYNDSDRTWDTVANINADPIIALYNYVVSISHSFSISASDAISPESISELNDELLNFDIHLYSGKTYKMLVEIQQWLTDSLPVVQLTPR